MLALRATPDDRSRDRPALQKIMFMVLPFVIIPFAIRFPVGLMIYWVTTNLWTAGQGITTRTLYSAAGLWRCSSRNGQAVQRLLRMRTTRTTRLEEIDEIDDLEEAEDKAAAEKQRKKDKAAKAKAKSKAKAANEERF